MNTIFNGNYKDILSNLSLNNFNEMQIAVFEKAKEFTNILLLSPTGSGKTLAYLIPTLNSIDVSFKGIQAIIIVPSRELAIQIEGVFKSMKTNLKVSCCYGGHDVKTEQNSLLGDPAIVIATPGRLADHIKRQSFNTKNIRMVILDEFDKSLQLGFQVQLHHIFKSLNGDQKHILTSATNMHILPDFLPFKNPETINFLQDEVLSKLEINLVKTQSANKVDSLLKLIASFNQEPCLIFCNHRDAVERISAYFAANNFDHGVFHGQLEQIDREKNLLKFKSGCNNVLIATDLASRGLDIPEIKHIVHYQMPHHMQEFTHRNGRTARMHADGDAYLILADDETLPLYIEKSVKEISLPGRTSMPPSPLFAMIYFSAGKKDKISKGDIAGLLMKKGGLESGDIGLITTLDHASYVAIKRKSVKDVLDKIKNEKLKKIKVKIEVAS